MREMRDSGIEWIRDIPSNWTFARIGGLYGLRVKKVSDRDYQPLSVTKLGILPQLETAAKTNAHDDRKLVRIGDFAINSRSDRRGSCGISIYEGSVSLINTVLYPIADMNPQYYDWLFHTTEFADEFYRWGHGIVDDLWTTGWQDMKNIVIIRPPLSEQLTIATFLNAKCVEIEALIADIQAQIDTLEQYKRSVITEAVTKGLNPNAEIKDSGVPWIGMIPTHWEAKKTKFLFEIVKRIAGKEGFDVLSVTQKGLKVKDLTDYSGQIAENYFGYQFVYPTDYVMNHRDLLTGWVDCSKRFGVTSPDYRVFRLLSKDEHDLEYFKYVFQCLYLNKVYYSFGNGVSGLGRWRLQTSTFLNFFLPVPPCAEQRQIAGYISDKILKIDSIIDEKRKQLSVLDSYKKSLIFEYVTGKKEVSEAVTVVGIDPHVLRLAIIADMLKELNVKRKRIGKRELKGKVVSQKLLYLSDEHLEHGLGTHYYRYQNGPLDLQLDSYINALVSNGWYEVDTSDGAESLVEGKNHAEFLERYGEQLAQYKSSIQALIQYFRDMKRTQIERFATLFAVWNDLIIDGNPAPSDDQIINEAMTNWTPNKGNISHDTWQDTLTKMKRDKIVPKGLGLHTLPKPEGGKSDA